MLDAVVIDIDQYKLIMSKGQKPTLVINKGARLPPPKLSRAPTTHPAQENTREDLQSEIDISVSKLLGFKTFAKSLRVSVSENLVSEKKSRFRFRKNLVSEKSLGLGFGKFGLGKEKIQITRTVLVMMSQIWDLGPIGTNQAVNLVRRVLRHPLPGPAAPWWSHQAEARSQSDIDEVLIIFFYFSHKSFTSGWPDLVNGDHLRSSRHLGQSWSPRPLFFLYLNK